MSVKHVQGHISAIERKLGKTVKIAEKGADMKLSDVIKLGRKTNSIVSELKKSTNDYESAEPTPEEAHAIHKQMETIVNMTETQLDLLVANKARIDELHVAGLVKRNMLASQEVGVKFSQQLQEKAPADLKESAIALEARRKKAFEKAVGIYANSQGGEDQADGEDDSD